MLQGNFAIPGSIGAAPIHQPLSPTNPYARATPTVLHYGETEPKGNLVLFMKLCESLAKRVDAKLAAVCVRVYPCSRLLMLCW
jgi:hypothetical protein